MFKYQIKGKLSRNDYSNKSDCIDAGINAAKRAEVNMFSIYKNGTGYVGRAEYLKYRQGRYEWFYHEGYDHPVEPKKVLEEANSKRIYHAEVQKAEERAFAKNRMTDINELNAMVKLKLAEADKWERASRLINEGKFSAAQKVVESMMGSQKQVHPAEIRDKIEWIKRFDNYNGSYELKRDIERVDLYRKHPSIKRRK